MLMMQPGFCSDVQLQELHQVVHLVDFVSQSLSQKVSNVIQMCASSSPPQLLYELSSKELAVSIPCSKSVLKSC